MERGTNRKDFDKNSVKKYMMKLVQIFINGQAFYLYNQLKNISKIQTNRKKKFYIYVENLNKLIKKELILGMNLNIKSNYHMKYILLKNLNQREKLRIFLEKKNTLCFTL